MGGFLPPIFDAQKCLVKKIALQKSIKYAILVMISSTNSFKKNYE